MCEEALHEDLPLIAPSDGLLGLEVRSRIERQGRYEDIPSLLSRVGWAKDFALLARRGMRRR